MNSVLALIPIALLPAMVAAEPVATRFADQTFEVLLQDVDPTSPPLRIASQSFYGGGAVEVGLAIDVADADGDPTCAYGLVEGSRHATSFWLPGPYCDAGGPALFSYWLFAPIDCFSCDWTAGFASEVTWRSEIRGGFMRYRPDAGAGWTYGWVAFQAIVFENLTCNPDCEGIGTTIPYINIIAVGFDTQPGSPLPIGAGLCGADLNFDGLLDLADLQLFVENFIDERNLADRDANGVFDLADIQRFITDFAAGCS